MYSDKHESLSQLHFYPRQLITAVLMLLGLFLHSGCASRIKEFDPEAVDRFNRTLSYPRTHALNRPPGDLPYLEHALSNPSATIRINAARDLEYMGPPAILAKNALTVCAEDKNAAVRRSCKRALAAVSADPEKPQSRGVEPTVEPLAETPDSEKNEPDKTAEVFPRRAIEVAKLDLPLVGRAAELALRRAAKRKLEKEEPEKIRAWRGEITYLSGVLDGDRRENREAAVEVLRYLSAYLDEALPGLRKALNDEDSGIQSRAAFALGEARDSDSVSNLGALLEKPAVKDYAVRALQAIGTAEAQKALKKAKIKPPNDAVLTASISARGRPDLSARELSDFCRQSTFELGAPAPKLNEYIEACIEASASFY